MTRDGGRPLSNSQPGTETLSSTVYQGLKAASTQLSMLDDILLWLNLLMIASMGDIMSEDTVPCPFLTPRKYEMLSIC